MSLLFKFENSLNVLFKYAKRTEVVVFDYLLNFGLADDFLSRILLLHRPNNILYLDVGHILFYCTSLAVSTEFAIF